MKGSGVRVSPSALLLMRVCRTPARACECRRGGRGARTVGRHVRASRKTAEATGLASGRALKVRAMLEASRVRDADGDRLVVETDEPAFALALSELFFEEQHGRHIKRFPPGTLGDGIFVASRLNSNVIFRRFEAQLEPLLRQTARLEPAPGKTRFERRVSASTAPASTGGSPAARPSRSAASTSPRAIWTSSCRTRGPLRQRSPSETR